MRVVSVASTICTYVSACSASSINTPLNNWLLIFAQPSRTCDLLRWSNYPEVEVGDPESMDWCSWVNGEGKRKAHWGRLESVKLHLLICILWGILVYINLDQIRSELLFSIKESHQDG